MPSLSRSAALRAPRILNELVRFSDSTLRWTSPSLIDDSHGEGSSGVRGMREASRRRASYTSITVGSGIPSILIHMILESAAVGPFFKNGYVAGCERTKQAVFIDPGDEVEELLAFIAAEQLQVLYILLTHAHVDHVSGVAEAKRTLNVPIYLHRDDLPLYQNAVQHGMLFGLTVEEPPPVDRYYDGEGPITFGDYSVR